MSDERWIYGEQRPDRVVEMKVKVSGELHATLWWLKRRLRRPVSDVVRAALDSYFKQQTEERLHAKQEARQEGGVEEGQPGDQESAVAA